MKKAFALLLCLVLTVGLFAACTSKPAEPANTPAAATATPAPATATPAPAAEPASEPESEPASEPEVTPEPDPYPAICDYGTATLSYWFPIGPTVATKIESYKDIDAAAELERRTGVHIEWQNPSVIQMAEGYSLMVSSGDYTDLVCHRFGTSYPAGPDAAVEDGVYYRLNELIDKFAPHYKSVFDADPAARRDTVTDAGTKWGMYCYYKDALVTYGLAYRKDIGDQIGIAEAPTTFAGWEQVFDTFIANGYEEPLYIANGLNDQGTWLSAYGIGRDFYLDGNTVKFGQVQPQFKDYLAQLREWYQKGYLFKDFSKDTRDMLIADKALVSWCSNSLACDELVASGTVANPDFYLMPTAHPVLKEGDQVHFRAVASTTGQPTAISTNCKDPEIAVKWLDWMFSDEGQFFCNYGVEGVTYTMVNSEPQYTDLILHNDVSVTNTLEVYLIFCCTVNWNATQQLSASKPLCDEVWGASPCDQVMPTTLTRTAEEGAEYSAIMNDVNTYISENVAKFINGSRSLDEFDDYVAQIEAMRLDRALQIVQDTYDRYLQR